jgi:uncharacterized protein (DUF952 family)
MSHNELTTATTATSTTIYKILTNEEWAEFQNSGVFRGNPLDQQDGYIHMSYYEQVDKTVQKFFSGRESDIRLVHVNTTLLFDNELRPERNKPGGDIYPHIYGTIPIIAVIKTAKILEE